MEAFLEAIGWIALVLLVGVGLLAGWIAALLTGGGRASYMVIGAVAAVATPFVLATLGIGVLAAGGLLLMLAVALIGAVLVIALVRALTKNRRSR